MAGASSLQVVLALIGMVAGQRLRGRVQPAVFHLFFFLGLLILGGYLALRILY